MSSPSNHLLKTFAAVPVSNRVLDLGCGHQCHAGPLALLGFDLHACAVDPDAVVAVRVDLAGLMDSDEAQRRVVPVPRLDALGYPDAFFDWIVAYDVFDADPDEAALLDVLAETRRVLASGGWIYVAVPPREAEEGRGFTSEILRQIMEQAGFALAEEPEVRETEGRCLLEGIYRRVDAGMLV